MVFVSVVPGINATDIARMGVDSCHLSAYFRNLDMFPRVIVFLLG
jgi:hypothetical protein